MGQGSNNAFHAFTTGGLVLGFKIVKGWIEQQKENKKLIKTKDIQRIATAKTRIYPRFLFQSLNCINARMTSGLDDSPEIILRLSDLLSYLLYESSEESVPLEKELDMVANLLHIEKNKSNTTSNTFILRSLLPQAINSLDHLFLFPLFSKLF